MRKMLSGVGQQISGKMARPVERAAFVPEIMGWCLAEKLLVSTRLQYSVGACAAMDRVGEGH
jgi:hypothetical protein